MDYNVRIASTAEDDFVELYEYLLNDKCNSQAAEHFFNDFQQTKEVLSRVAGSLKLCDNAKLAALGYHRLNFVEMNYFMLYRIEGNDAVIDDIFHGLEDYEKKMR